MIIIVKVPTNTIVLTEAVGIPGPPGPGVAVGGDADQVLTKIDATDFNTEWRDPSGGDGAKRPPNILTLGPTSVDSLGPTGADYADIDIGILNAGAGDILKFYDYTGPSPFIVEITKSLTFESGNETPMNLFGITGFVLRPADNTTFECYNFFLDDRVVIANVSAVNNTTVRFFDGETRGTDFQGRFDMEDREFIEIGFTRCNLFFGNDVEEIALVDQINKLSIIDSTLSYRNSGEFALINRNTAAVFKTIELEFTNMTFDPLTDTEFNGVFHSNVLANPSEINQINYTGNNVFRFIGDYTAQELQDFLFPIELSSKISPINGFIQSDNGYFKIVDNVVIEMAETQDDETTTTLPALSAAEILTTSAFPAGDALTGPRGIDYTSDGTLIAADSNLDNLIAYSVNPDTGLMVRIFTLSVASSPDALWIDRINDFIFVDNSSTGALDCFTWDGSAIAFIGTLVDRSCGTTPSPFNDFIVFDGTYYYAMDASGPNSNQIFAFTFDGLVAPVEIASLALPGNRGSATLAYDPVGNYIFATHNIGGFQQNIIAYLFNGVAFTLQAGVRQTGLASAIGYDTSQNALVIADLVGNSILGVTYNGVTYTVVTASVNQPNGIAAMKMVNNYIFLFEQGNVVPNINSVYKLATPVFNLLAQYNCIVGNSARSNVSNDFLISDNFSGTLWQTTKFVDSTLFTPVLQFDKNVVDSVVFEYSASKVGHLERGQITATCGSTDNSNAIKQDVVNPPGEDPQISFSSDVQGDNFRISAKNDAADLDITLKMFNFDERLS